MTTAFRCDRCKEYNEGSPEITVKTGGFDSGFLSLGLCKTCGKTYVEAVEAIGRTIRQARSDWLDAKSEPPPHGMNAWVYDARLDFVRVDSYNRGIQHWWFSERRSSENITHWMPLDRSASKPEPPRV